MNDRDERLRVHMDAIVPLVGDGGDWAAVTTRASESRARWSTWRRLAPVFAIGATVAVFAVLLVYTDDGRTGNPAAPTEAPTGPQGVVNDYLDNGVIDGCHANADYEAARGEQALGQYGDYQGALDDAMANPALVGTSATPCGSDVPAALPTVLSRTQRDDDRMDPRFAGASDWPLDTGSTRLSQSPDGGQLYVSLAKDGKLCLGRDHPRFIVHRCEPVGDLARAGSVSLALDDPTGDRFDLFGVVADGVTKARAAGVIVDVVENTYWIDSPKRDTPVETLTAAGWRALGQRVADAKYSILTRQRTSADDPPKGLGVTRSSSSTEPEGDPVVAKARLAVERDGIRYFVAPADNGNICILVATENDLAPACRNPKTLANIDSWMMLTDRYQVTIVPDGFTTAQTPTGTVQITNNVLVLTPEPSPGGTAVLTGPSGTAELKVPPSAGDPVPPALRLPVTWGQRRALVVIDGPGDPTPGRTTMMLWVAPRLGGGRCWWVTVGTSDDSVFTQSCEAKPLQIPPDAASVSVLNGPAGTIALGVAGSDVDELELRFADGTRQRLAVLERLILAEVDPIRMDAGRQPTALVTIVDGREAERFDVNPSSAPAMFNLGVSLPPPTGTP